VGQWDGTVAYACADCCEPARGKFEGNHGRNETGTARVLYALYLEGLADDEMGQDERAARFGRYLLFIDYSGFVTFEEYATTEEADKRFQALYIDGMGMTEWDAIISDDRDGYYVTFEGKTLGSYPRYNRARAAIRLEAFRSGCYPDAWHVNERGNVSHVNY
jgi:hypothetical protein